MKQLLEQANQLHIAGNLLEAERLYNAMLCQRPWHPLLCFYLGTLYMQVGKGGLAIMLLEHVVKEVPDMSEAYVNLGCAYRREQMVDKAREVFEKALEMRGEDHQVLNNLGTLFVNEGNPKEGEKFLRRALKVNPEDAQAYWNLSLVLLEQERWAEGFDLYDWGLKSKDRLVREFEVPKWDGEHGHTVVAYGEQGMGDEIMFSSCIPDLLQISKEVIIECNPRLASLLQRSFPQCKVYGTRKEEWIKWPRDHVIDSAVAFGSLPRHFRRQEVDFPHHHGYLKADPKKQHHWAQKLAELGPRPKIGISWIGGGKRTRVDLRSMPLDYLRPILELDADFISLQYTPGCDQEIAKLDLDHDLVVHHWPEAVANKHEPNEYDNTAALVSNLDLVVSVCTSLVHLSAGLNIPVFVMVPAKPAWRYGLTQDHMVWYPEQTRLWRRRENETWERVIMEVKGAVEHFIAEFKPKAAVQG